MNKGVWKDYCSFSKKERTAVFVLLFLIVVFVILPFFFSPKFKKPVVEPLPAQFVSSQSVTANDTDDERATDTTIEQSRSSVQLFYFNPNTLDEEGWKKLGLPDKTIHTIINYRNKGGKFKQPEDIRKIYGLNKEQADKLIPFIQIKPNTAQEKNITEAPKKNEDVQPATIAVRSKKIDINTATAEDFKTLPGIGDVLGNRIVKFRNAIHGFKSVEDIKKTYGLSDSVYQIILPYLTIGETSSKN